MLISNIGIEIKWGMSKGFCHPEREERLKKTHWNVTPDDSVTHRYIYIE